MPGLPQRSFTFVQKGTPTAEEPVRLAKAARSAYVVTCQTVSQLSDFTIATWLKLPEARGRVFDFGSFLNLFS